MVINYTFFASNAKETEERNKQNGGSVESRHACSCARQGRGSKWGALGDEWMRSASYQPIRAAMV